MRDNARIFFAIAVLALAALACQAVSGGGDVNVPDIEIPTIEVPDIEIPTIEVPDILNNDVILSDDFSSDQWGTGTDEDSSVEYVDEALRFIVNKDLYYVWSTPDGEDYENVHLEVTAQNTSTDSTSAFGVVCNLQITDTSYYFAVTGAGEYAIVLSTLTDEIVLTNDGKWETSDAIAVGADSYRIGADCGSDGTLTLYVDGQEVASVSDTTYASGGVALFAWSGEETNATDVSFDDFEMTKLP